MAFLFYMLYNNRSVITIPHFLNSSSVFSEFFKNFSTHVCWLLIYFLLFLSKTSLRQGAFSTFFPFTTMRFCPERFYCIVIIFYEKKPKPADHMASAPVLFRFPAIILLRRLSHAGV